MTTIGESTGIVTTDEDGLPARPMRKDAARNRTLLIEAGREVFARRGLEASLDEIAKQAGVGVGTAYRHFANKYELATAIMHERIGEIRVAAERGAEAADPWAGLVDFFETALDLQAADRGLREVMLGVHDPSKSDEVRAQLFGPVTALFRRAQDAGAIRADAQMSDLALMLMMLCTASDIAGDAVPDIGRRYLPTLLAGLRPGGPELSPRALTDDELTAVTEAKSGLGPRPTP